MSDLANMLLAQSAGAAILAGFVWVVVRTFRPRPCVAHLLWLIVLAKLVTPPVLAWRAPALDPIATATAGPTTPPTPTRVLHLDLHTRADGTTALARPANGARTTPIATPAHAPRARRSDAAPPGAGTPHSTSPWVIHWASHWATWILSIWIAGALWTATRLWRSCRDLARRVARGSEPPAPLARKLDDLAARMDVRPPRLRVVPDISGPFLCGLFRPVLCWPKGWRPGEDATATVLAHELAHLRRRDHWVARFEVLIALVHWWNPLFWWARREMREHAERACDAWAVSTMPDRRRTYASTLVDALERHIHPSAMVALGALPGSRRAFEERLRMILQSNTKTRLSRWSALPVGITALALLAGPVFSQDGRESREAARVVGLRTRQDPEKQQQPAKQDPAKTKAARKVEVKITVDGVDIQALPAERRAQVLRELGLKDVEGHAIREVVESRQGEQNDAREGHGQHDAREGHGQHDAREGHGHGDAMPRGLAKQILGELRRELQDDEDVVRLGIADDIERVVRGALEGEGPDQQAISGLVQGLVQGIGKEIELEIADDEDLRELGLAGPLRGLVGSLIRSDALGSAIEGMVGESLKDLEIELGDLEHELPGMLQSLEGLKIELDGDLELALPELLGELGGVLEIELGGDLEQALAEIPEALQLGEIEIDLRDLGSSLSELETDLEDLGGVEGLEALIRRAVAGETQRVAETSEAVRVAERAPLIERDAARAEPARTGTADIEAELAAARRELEAAQRQLEKLERELRRQRRDH